MKVHWGGDGSSLTGPGADHRATQGTPTVLGPPAVPSPPIPVRHQLKRHGMAFRSRHLAARLHVTWSAVARSPQQLVRDQLVTVRLLTQDREPAAGKDAIQIHGLRTRRGPFPAVSSHSSVR
jgi:hypothetical protein